MLLNDVVNYNHSIEKTNVNNVNDFKELIKKIDKRKNSIQRGIIEIQERAKYRQDIRDNIIKDIDHLDYIENLKDYSFNDNMRISIEFPYSLMEKNHA